MLIFSKTGKTVFPQNSDLSGSAQNLWHGFGDLFEHSCTHFWAQRIWGLLQRRDWQRRWWLCIRSKRRETTYLKVLWDLDGLCCINLQRATFYFWVNGAERFLRLPKWADLIFQYKRIQAWHFSQSKTCQFYCVGVWGFFGCVCVCVFLKDYFQFMLSFSFFLYFSPHFLCVFFFFFFFSMA